MVIRKVLIFNPVIQPQSPDIMEGYIYNLYGFNIQLSDTQGLAIFWVLSVLCAFNISYYLYRCDQKHYGQSANNSLARIWLTVFLGNLVMIGTYANTLAQKPFVLSDCLLLAFIAAHGWMADEMVDGFIEKVRKIQ